MSGEGFLHMVNTKGNIEINNSEFERENVSRSILISTFFIAIKNPSNISLVIKNTSFKRILGEALITSGITLNTLLIENV